MVVLKDIDDVRDRTTDSVIGGTFSSDNFICSFSHTPVDPLTDVFVQAQIP